MSGDAVDCCERKGKVSLRETTQVPLDRYFFFSYARVNRKNANRERVDGSTHNVVDQFFQRLCQCVSDITNADPRRVGYRDLNELDVSAEWPQELHEAVQTCPVQIALISPHYLSSMNCGREFEVFLRRFKLLKEIVGPGTIPCPIIPVFWMNEEHCWPYSTDRAQEFLRGLQLTGPDMPDDYPTLGLLRQLLLGKPELYDRICFYLADRIKKLAERDPALPRLQGIGDFRDLPSAFDPAQSADKPVHPIPTPVVNLAQTVAPLGFAGRVKPPALDLAP